MNNVTGSKKKKFIELKATPGRERSMRNPDYDPNRLLDELIRRFNLKNDAALSRALKVQPPVISKYRHNWLPMSDAFLVRVHDGSQIPIAELRDLLGVKAPIEPFNAVARS